MKTVIITLAVIIIIMIAVGTIWLLSVKETNKETNRPSLDEVSAELVTLFNQELTWAGLERVGQPIEGFSAFIYLEAFPGFEKSDFDGVKSLEGMYKLEGGELKYERTADGPVTSAEETISKEGHKTLLINFSKRMGVQVRNEADIADLLEKLSQKDSKPLSYRGDDFSIWFPDGWFAHELGSAVFFTHDQVLDIPANTEGYALAPWARVEVNKIDIDELFAQNLWIQGSEFLVSKQDVRIKTMQAVRVVTTAAGAAGEVLHYVFDAGDGRVLTLAHYPYQPKTKDTDEFEQAVSTLVINYTMSGQNSSGSGGKPMAGWNTYQNKELGFAIDYPPDWQYRERGMEESVALVAVFAEKVPAEDYPLLIYQTSSGSKPIGQIFQQGSLVIDISIDQTEPLARQMLSSFRWLDV